MNQRVECSTAKNQPASATWSHHCHLHFTARARAGIFTSHNSQIPLFQSFALNGWATWLLLSPKAHLWPVSVFIFFCNIWHHLSPLPSWSCWLVLQQPPSPCLLTLSGHFLSSSWPLCAIVPAWFYAWLTIFLSTLTILATPWAAAIHLHTGNSLISGFFSPLLLKAPGPALWQPVAVLLLQPGEGCVRVKSIYSMPWPPADFLVFVPVIPSLFRVPPCQLQISVPGLFFVPLPNIPTMEAGSYLLLPQMVSQCWHPYFHTTYVNACTCLRANS